MTIQFAENNNYREPNSYLDTEFDLYCGAILPSVKGYCNYVSSIQEDFGTPTDDNYKEWYMIQDFIDYSEKIKIVRPIPIATIGNHELQFSLTTVTSSGIKDCYNPTIAETTLETYEPTTNISIIAKNVEIYDEGINYAYSICSTLANFDQPIFSDSDLTIFADSLINESSTLKTFRQLANSAIPLFASNEFILVELIKEEDKDWRFNKCYILSYLEASDRYVNSQTIDYAYIHKGTLSNVIETYSKTLSQCSFQSYSATGISTDDFTLSETDYESALEILKLEDNLKGILAIEYDSSMDIVPSIFTEEKVILFTGCYDLSRYFLESSKSVKIINDFKKGNSGSYFTLHRNNTVIVGNMYRKYDNYNECYRWIPYLGTVAGIHWSKEIKSPVDMDDIIGSENLMFLPTETDRINLLDNGINSIINRKGQNVIYGNRILNDKLIIKDIFNVGIIESLRYKFLLLRDNFNDITAKQQYTERELIYNEIDVIIKQFYGYISNNSISYSVDDGVLVFTIIIWLLNTVDNFVIELDFTLQ